MKLANKLAKLNVKRLMSVFAVVLTTVMLLSTVVSAAGIDGEVIAQPIIDLINSLLKWALAIVFALGSVYCVILGVKFAKAEEPQEREKAKSHMKNAIIGFVLIFVLILALNLAEKPLIDWVNGNAGTTVIDDAGSGTNPVA